jgi:hypothetical protein
VAELDLDNSVRLSVVSVSDYESGEIKTWDDEKKILKGLSEQDIEISFEVILVESSSLKDQEVPDLLYELVPQLKIHYFESERSAELKEYGIKCCKSPYIAVLESDCVPSSNWLRLLLKAMETGQYAAASGRTFYGEQTSFRRVMNLFHRSYDDPGKSDITNLVSNNGAVYKKDILLKYPYPDAVTPFESAERRNNLMRVDNLKFYYERQVTMQHAIGGVSFIWDVGRNKGHQLMAIHKRRNIFALYLKKLKVDLKHINKLGTTYLKWYDWPLVPMIIILDVIPFFKGAIEAMSNKKILVGSAYR